MRDRLLTAASPEGSLYYTYDYNGNLTGIQSSTPNGSSVMYQYDALNRLSRVVDTHRGQNLVTTNSYDAVGNVTGYLYSNGVDTVYSYNSLNRMTNMVVRTASGTLASYGYTLGPANGGCNCSAGTHITAVSEVIGSATRSVAYGYDNLYRLTNETIAADSAGPTGNIVYRYDAVGNRTNLASTGAVAAPLPPANYSYDANDRLNSDIYDANGNTTTNSTGNYRYDFENHLAYFNNRGAVISYDGDGNRVSEEVGATTTFYLVDDKNPTGYSQVLEELQSINSGPTNLTRVYTYGQSLISQDQTNSGSWTLSFYGYDGHGNARFLMNNAGSVTDTYTYDAFGNLIHNTGTTANDNLYTGEQHDPNTGFVYLRARHLNPPTGRFLTTDTWEGNELNPLSLNGYAYAADDPVNRVDPSGRDFEVLAVDITLDSIMGFGLFSFWSTPEESKGVQWDPPRCRPLKEKGLETKIIQVEQGAQPPYKGPLVDDGTYGFGKKTHFDPPFYPTEIPKYEGGGYFTGTMEDNPSILLSGGSFETCRVCVFEKKVHSCGPCKHWKWGDKGDLGTQTLFPTYESPTKVFVDTVNKYYPNTIPAGAGR